MPNGQVDSDRRAKEIKTDGACGLNGVLNLEFVSDLGSGRAAEVSLVRDVTNGTLYAEKKFKSKRGLSRLLRDSLFRLCFQAPFPYQARESALQTSLFRRKILRDLTEFWFGTPAVADASYIRWDQADKAFVLGTEYIEGRGPKPGPVNPRRIRHLLHNWPVRLFKFLTRSEFRKARGGRWEIDEATARLEAFKEKFHQAGFIGSEWQVNKTLSVPTSNLLRDENGNWILIDVESAFPAIIFPRDIWRALKFGSIPLFDDTDFIKLRAYLTQNAESLQAVLGQERIEALYHYVDQMEYHSNAWKDSEPAIFSHRHRLITDATLRRNIRHGLVDQWQLTGRISDQRAEQLRKSPIRFYVYLLYDLIRDVFAIPSMFLRGFKKIALRGFGVLSGAFDLLHSAFFDEKRLKEMAESYTNKEIDGWQQSGRLTQPEADKLRQELDSPTNVEYLKGFMVHAGFQALEPPFIGEGVLVSLAIALDSPNILAAYFISPILRTGYTLYRKIKNRGSGISYRYALLVGAFPKIGILAYPLQMASTHPNLSVFLAQCQASRVGSHFPLFGGLNSRLEHFCLKMVDWFASVEYELFVRRWGSCTEPLCEDMDKREAEESSDADMVGDISREKPQ